MNLSDPTDLHRTRLTHTDLKPENILFTSSEFDIYYDARKVRASDQSLFSMSREFLQV